MISTINIFVGKLDNKYIFCDCFAFTWNPSQKKKENLK